MNLARTLKDMATTGLALLRVAGAVHRQARALERQDKHLASIGALLEQLIKIQESRLRLELLKSGADDEALDEEWQRIKAAPPATVGAAARAEEENPRVFDIPGAIREALIEHIVPGALEDREITTLIERGGTQAELLDLLAQHGIPGGVFSGAVSAREARELERELAKEEKDQIAQIELAAKELGERARAGIGENVDPMKGEPLGGASFGG